MIEEIRRLLADPLCSYYVSIAVAILPLARVFARAGFRPWWIAFAAVPFVGIVFVLGALAFKRWPVLAKGDA